jgi:hypothetical protein
MPGIDPSQLGGLGGAFNNMGGIFSWITNFMNYIQHIQGNDVLGIITIILAGISFFIYANDLMKNMSEPK